MSGFLSFLLLPCSLFMDRCRTSQKMFISLTRKVNFHLLTPSPGRQSWQEFPTKLMMARINPCLALNSINQALGAASLLSLPPRPPLSTPSLGHKTRISLGSVSWSRVGFGAIFRETVGTPCLLRETRAPEAPTPPRTRGRGI